MIKSLLLAAALIVASPIVSFAGDCQSVNASGGVGYVNIRSKPELNAPIITRWNNPENGSDWGSGTYCGREYVDFDGRTWSYISVTMQDGRYIEGWVSDKVLEFL